MVQMLAVLALAAASSSYAAGPAATLFSGAQFEAPLLQLQTELRASAPGRASARAQSNLESLSWDALRLQQELRRLQEWDLPRMRVALRRRDGFAHSEVSQVLWKLRLLTRGLSDLERRAVSTRDEAQKDPGSVKPADRFRSSATWLRSDLRWFENDVRMVLVWELRNGGFWFESQDFERQSRDASSAAERVQALSDEIARKVRG